MRISSATVLSLLALTGGGLPAQSAWDARAAAAYLDARQTWFEQTQVGKRVLEEFKKISRLRRAPTPPMKDSVPQQQPQPADQR